MRKQKSVSLRMTGAFFLDGKMHQNVNSAFILTVQAAVSE